jgi:hypothetical protein
MSEKNFQVRDVFNARVVSQLVTALATAWTGFDEKGFCGAGILFV